MSTEQMDVGFLGVGQMGSGMAGRLLEAGHRVTVWNRSAGKAEALAGRGARVADSPAEAARAGIVFSMLANDAAVEAVTSAKAGCSRRGRGCCMCRAAR